MIDFYLKMVGSFVVPLLVVYLLGSFTRVHRGSAVVGLVAGVGFGLYSFISKTLAESQGIALLPSALMDNHVTGPLTFAITALAMLAATLILGRETSPLFWQDQAALDQAEQTGFTPLALGLVVLAFGLFLGFFVLL